MEESALNYINLVAKMESEEEMIKHVDNMDKEKELMLKELSRDYEISQTVCANHARIKESLIKIEGTLKWIGKIIDDPKLSNETRRLIRDEINISLNNVETSTKQNEFCWEIALDIMENEWEILNEIL